MAVSNNGIGIHPEYREQVFEIFKRLREKNVSGSGIGLTLCRRVVERAGGRIWAEGEPGDGATFRITLPAGDDAAHGG